MSLFGASAFASSGLASGFVSALVSGAVCAWASTTQEAGGIGAREPAAPRATTAATPSHRAIDRQRREPPFIAPVSLCGSVAYRVTGVARAPLAERRGRGPRASIAGYLKVSRCTPS